MGVHIWWEAVLLVGVVVLVALIYREEPAALRGAELDSLLVSGTALGLLAVAAGLTLRAGTPNLALGSVAIASALHFAEQSDQGAVVAVVPAVLAAAALGLGLALFVVVFHVPGWAASLATALAVIVLIEQRTGPVEVQGEWDPARHSVYLFGGFVAVAVLGGLFGTVRVVRRAVGGFRPVADPAARRGWGPAVLTSGAIVVSMVLALLAGVLLAAGGPGTVRPSSGFEWTGLALGAALLAGTSAFGRRGGIFGTVLAVVLLVLFDIYGDGRSWRIAPLAVAAAAIAAGLVVTRLVEAFGRPKAPGRDGEDWGDSAESTALGWGEGRLDLQDSWSSALPAQPTTRRAGPWAGDR